MKKTAKPPSRKQREERRDAYKLLQTWQRRSSYGVCLGWGPVMTSNLSRILTAFCPEWLLFFFAPGPDYAIRGLIKTTEQGCLSFSFSFSLLPSRTWVTGSNRPRTAEGCSCFFLLFSCFVLFLLGGCRRLKKSSSFGSGLAS